MRDIGQGEAVQFTADNEGGRLDETDPVLHPVSVDREVSLFDPSPKPDRVDHQAMPQIGLIRRVVRRPALPQGEEMTAIVRDRHAIDRLTDVHERTSGCVDVRHSGEHQTTGPAGLSGSYLHPDHPTGVVTHETGRDELQPVDQVLYAVGEHLHRPLLLRHLRGPETQRVGCDHAEAVREQWDDLAVLVPGARSLVQQQHSWTGARLDIVHLAVARVGVGASQVVHAAYTGGVRCAQGRTCSI